MFSRFRRKTAGPNSNKRLFWKWFERTTPRFNRTIDARKCGDLSQATSSKDDGDQQTLTAQDRESFVLESQRIARGMVLALAGLFLLLALCVVFFALTLVPGEFEARDTSFERVREIGWYGKGHGLTGRWIEFSATNGFLYNKKGDLVARVQDAGISRSPKIEVRRVPVYYSCIWNASIYPRNSDVFYAIGVGATALIFAGSLVIFVYRKHLILKPNKMGRPDKPSSRR